MIENYEDLRSLVSKKSNIDEFIIRSKSIGLTGGYGIKKVVAITDDHNERYTFTGVASIIGEDKMQSLVDQFKGLVAVELHCAKERVEEDLRKFKVVKTE